ncbi:hypothetical protein LHA31_10880 [Carnobacterium viridans]|uniref:ABC transporter n=1 Tax=Carnobacterium viridans TaxID=174587 RepID=A0A1H0YN27_9LACT|nr:hypothetical protein [Carnobacterium viridans]UDE95040.1 hypothetical protein LHA31_10880 [Carnobacterium viridans]SDQ16553.1 hypothetical protein SAMN04487752_1052 [Carnobacterium viridans]
MFKQSLKKADNHPVFSIKPKTIYSLSAEEVDFPILMKQFNRQLGSFPGVITKNETFIDYLTVRENMLLVLSLASNQMKRSLNLVVNEVLEELDLSDALADQPFKALPLNLSLQLQLRLNELCNKKVILVEDCFRFESASSKQDWLLSLRYYARTKDFSFILVTSDNQLLASEKPFDLNPIASSSRKVS